MRELKKGTKIKFSSISSFSTPDSEPVELVGVILGGAEAVRKMWSEEMPNAQDCYLVRRFDKLDQDFHHCVFFEEIIEVVK